MSVEVIIFSLGVALCVAGIQMKTIHGIAPWLLETKRRLRESYQTNPSCGRDCKVTFNPESIRFEGEASLYQSSWNSYVKWIWKEDLLLLIAHGGLRHVVVTRSLAQEEKQELAILLKAALPISLQ